MIPRALLHLNRISRQQPHVWHNVDSFRQAKGVDLPNWPDWCFMPLAAWVAIASEGAPMGSPAMLRAAGDASRLAAVGTWRYTQGIYRFDEDVAGALADTRIVGDMPTDVLLRLPEWCVYIETPGRKWHGETLHGFWAHVEHDINDSRPELRLLLDTDQGLCPQILHIGSWTVTEAISRWYGEAQNQSAKNGLALPEMDSDFIQASSVAIQPLLALVLYLCSEEPEIEDREHPGELARTPKPKRTKKGWRLFPPSKPRIWYVAESIGERLRREYDSEPTGRTVRPHLRRAHWHGFWSGPREGERKFRCKWLPPTLVAAVENDDLSKLD